MSVVGATAADAPPASEKLSPAAPNTGTAFVTRFRFEACFTRDMFASSVPVKRFFDSSAAIVRSANAACKPCNAPCAHRVPKFRLMNEAFTMTVAQVAPNLGAHVWNGR
jgi:hypothetical protein